jgi:hypothetical protein
MQQVAEVTAVDRRAQFRKRKKLLSDVFRGVEAAVVNTKSCGS